MKWWGDDDGMRRAVVMVCARLAIPALGKMKIGGRALVGFTDGLWCRGAVLGPRKRVAVCFVPRTQYEDGDAGFYGPGMDGSGHTTLQRPCWDILGSEGKIQEETWATYCVVLRAGSVAASRVLKTRRHRTRGRVCCRWTPAKAQRSWKTCGQAWPVSDRGSGRREPC